MSKKITLVESIISIGFDDKKAQAGLKKLKKQLKDSEKASIVSERRSTRKTRKNANAVKRERRRQKDSRRYLDESVKARSALEKRVLTYKKQQALISKETDRSKKKALKLEAKAQNDRIKKDITNRKRQKRYDREKANTQRRERSLGARRGSSRMGSSRGGYGVSSRTAMIAGGAGVVVAGNEASKAVKTTMTWENSVNALYTQEASINPEGAKERAQKIADRIYKMASASNTAPNVLMDAYNEMRPLANNAGVTEEHVLGMVSTMAQSTKATGLNPEEVDRFMLGFRQFAANLSGKTASGQELGQMRDSSSVLTSMLFKSMGMKANITPDAMATDIKSGKVNLQNLFSGMIKLQDTTKDGFELYKKGSMQGKQDKLSAMYRDSQMGFGGSMKGGLGIFLDTLTDVLKSNKSNFVAAGNVTGDVLENIGAGIKDISDAWKDLSSSEKDTYLTGVESLMAAVAGVFVVSKLKPVLTLLEAISAAASIPMAGLIAAITGMALLGKTFVDGDGGKGTADTLFGEGTLPEWLFFTDSSQWGDMFDKMQTNKETGLKANGVQLSPYLTGSRESTTYQYNSPVDSSKGSGEVSNVTIFHGSRFEGSKGQLGTDFVEKLGVAPTM